MKIKKSGSKKIIIYGQYRKNGRFVQIVEKNKKRKFFKNKPKLLEYLDIIIEEKIYRNKAEYNDLNIRF